MAISAVSYTHLDVYKRQVRLNTVNSKPTSVEEIFFIRNQISDADMKNLKNLLDMNDYVKNGRVTQKFIPMLVPVQFANLLKIKMNTPIILSLIHILYGYTVRMWGTISRHWR